MLKIVALQERFTVCQVEDYSLVNWNTPFCFVGQTDEENSFVCLTDQVPSNVIRREDGWRAFRILGVLDFSLIGILSKIASILADNSISIFALSTYNTDYVLMKDADFDRGLALLKASGYAVEA